MTTSNGPRSTISTFGCALAASYDAPAVSTTANPFRPWPMSSWRYFTDSNSGAPLVLNRTFPTWMPLGSCDTINPLGTTADLMESPYSSVNGSCSRGPMLTLKSAVSHWADPSG